MRVFDLGVRELLFVLDARLFQGAKLLLEVFPFAILSVSEALDRLLIAVLVVSCVH